MRRRDVQLKARQARCWLQNILADRSQMPASAIYLLGQHAGHSTSSLTRAKKRIGALSFRVGGLGDKGYWAWSSVTLNKPHVDRALPLLAHNDESQLPRLSDGVECMAFRRPACGQCPRTPHLFCGARGPKRPKAKPAAFCFCCIMISLLANLMAEAHNARS